VLVLAACLGQMGLTPNQSVFAPVRKGVCFGILELPKLLPATHASGNMTINALIRQRWIKWPIGFLFWTLVGLSFAFQFYISAQKRAWT